MKMPEVYLALVRKAAEAGWTVALMVQREEGGFLPSVTVTRQNGQVGTASDYASAVALLAELESEPEPIGIRVALDADSAVVARCPACFTTIVAVKLVAYWKETKDDSVTRCGNCGGLYRLPLVGSSVEIGGKA